MRRGKEQRAKMIAINLDDRNYINIRQYTPSFIKLGLGSFATQSENSDTYTVLGSATLTASFLLKYELEHLIYELMSGTTIIMPNISAFREAALRELRQFRYDNLAELPDFKNFRALPNIKNEQPKKVLVNLEHGVVSLKLYETSLLQKRIKKLLGELRLASWFRVDNYYYTKGALGPTQQRIWKNRFEEIGLSVEFKEVDKNLSVAIFTNSKDIEKEETLEYDFGF